MWWADHIPMIWRALEQIAHEGEAWERGHPARMRASGPQSQAIEAPGKRDVRYASRRAGRPHAGRMPRAGMPAFPGLTLM